MALKDLFTRKGHTVKELRTEMASLQHSINILLSGQEEAAASSEGNPYTTPDEQIKAMNDKYEGRAKWGVQQFQNIIDVRAAFIIASGLRVTDEKGRETTRELDWVKQFIEHNDLNEEGPQEFAKEAELEGRALFRLIPNKDKANIDLRWVSYMTNHYKVMADPADYKRYTSVKWQPEDKEPVVLDEHEFVYKKFAGRMNKVNEISPKVAKILRLVEDLDRALVDLRAINHLFASPTPYFKVQEPSQAKSLFESLKNINWKIGKLLVSTADYTLVGADVQGIEALIKEITMYVKIISGATGIPVHFLGLPDLMSNRSTSSDLFELIEASTSKERHVWLGGYEEILYKAMVMANDKLQAGLDPDKNPVKVDIPKLTSKKLEELTTVWLPLFTGGVIDLDTMLAKVPDADSKNIKQNLEEETQRTIDRMRSEEDEDNEDDN